MTGRGFCWLKVCEYVVIIYGGFYDKKKTRLTTTETTSKQTNTNTNSDESCSVALTYTAVPATFPPRRPAGEKWPQMAGFIWAVQQKLSPFLLHPHWSNSTYQYGRVVRAPCRAKIDLLAPRVLPLWQYRAFCTLSLYQERKSKHCT